MDHFAIFPSLYRDLIVRDFAPLYRGVIYKPFRNNYVFAISNRFQFRLKPLEYT